MKPEKPLSEGVAPVARHLAPRNPRVRLLSILLTLTDPRSYFQVARLIHYYNYTHVRPRRLLHLGDAVTLAPNISLSNAGRISIGHRTHIGASCTLWAGDAVGRITIGSGTTLGPEVFVTASNYGTSADTHIMQQPKLEEDVIIGDEVWLGARVTVLPGVTIPDGCIVGAGAVVTKSLPPNTIVAGNPARVIRVRN